MLGNQPRMAGSIMRNARGTDPQLEHRSASPALVRHADSAPRDRAELLRKHQATVIRATTCHAAAMCHFSALTVSWWPPAVWHEPPGNTGRWQPLGRCHGLHAVQRAYLAARALQCIDASHLPQERSRRFHGFWMGLGHLQILARRIQLLALATRRPWRARRIAGSGGCGRSGIASGGGRRCHNPVARRPVLSCDRQ